MATSKHDDDLGSTSSTPRTALFLTPAYNSPLKTAVALRNKENSANVLATKRRLGFGTIKKVCVIVAYIVYDSSSLLLLPPKNVHFFTDNIVY